MVILRRVTKTRKEIYTQNVMSAISNKTAKVILVHVKELGLALQMMKKGLKKLKKLVIQIRNFVAVHDHHQTHSIFSDKLLTYLVSLLGWIQFTNAHPFCFTFTASQCNSKSRSVVRKRNHLSIQNNIKEQNVITASEGNKNRNCIVFPLFLVLKRMRLY